ncbi:MULTISPECIES: GNAT family N-acetyltransferase [Leclercia]|uniref:GNAT family N-acetyltransferase n=1 Tax=Leclercia pneumoniae TaxID=2815358 RepID=A0ABX8JZ22_9ENTR|nr:MULTISPECIES: GNAT family protein [Leclercia]KKY81282.1 GCN5 family acetyltransferase [Enterobacter cloacae]MEB7501926.1 GNAT family N-acetyltransferase [Leclercia pneumoniae]QSW35273.1 GNAT family N-acetyltransferase [Leclercia pneumoniae]QWW79804.1 GNAT family N-acetyltransferase [Leclercia pneumoniae]
MPVLHTPRLTCSPLGEADWSFFLALQQDPDVMRYVADNRPETAIREAFESRLPEWTPGSAHWLCLLVRDTLSQTPLGVTGYLHHEEDIAEVGFLFAPQAQGLGYGFESLKAVCDFAFNEGGIRRLTATVTAGNLPSRRLLEKQGFVLEGELRENYQLAGRWHNDWLFGLLKKEYQQA